MSVTKLSKSQFVNKMKFDLSRFDTKMKEHKKEVMLKDYDYGVCRNRWDITRPGERRRERV